MDGTFIDVVIKKLQWFLDHPEVTWSGSGIYALSLTGSAATAVASWCCWRKKKSPPSSEEHLRQPLPAQKTDNQFNSGGGEQTNLQGDHGIAKQINNYNNISSDVLADVRKLAVTDSALASFFKILEEPQVPPGDLDSKLREFACQYKELKLRLQVISCDDPEVKALKKQADQAFENGRFSEVEELLNHIDERCDKAILQLHKIQAEAAAALEKQQLCKAENLVSRAKLQRLQYRYAKSAKYYQEAAAALPEGYEWERADYLNAAGYALDNIARYADALCLYKQSLSIHREIGDRKGEGKMLNNISAIYQAQGEYSKALDYMVQGLLICREIGDKELEGATLNNIAALAYAKGDYPNALKYLEQSLPLLREMHHKEAERWSLNNIGQIHKQQGNYTAAMQYYKQALAIAREIKDKATESTCLNNIGQLCDAQEDYDAALEHLEQSLTIRQQIGDRQGECTSLNNIAMVYEAKGDYLTTLKLHKKALAIAEEIGAKAHEAVISDNIGILYIKQGELAKAEPYFSRAVELGTQLEHPDLEDWRKVLAALRAKLRGRATLDTTHERNTP